jgi:Tol biopolymer transport system component
MKNHKEAVQTGTLKALLALIASTLLLFAPAATAVASTTPLQGDQNQNVATVRTAGTARLNVRAGPGTQYPIIGQLPSGTTYTVLARDESAQWLQLAIPQIPQQSGWVFSQYTTLYLTSAELPVASPPTPPPASATGGEPEPSGRIAFPAFDSNRGTYDIYIVNADGTNLRRVVEEASQPALSPNGQYLAYHHWQVDDRGLVVSNSNGANPLRVTDFLEDGLPAWSPDSTKIVFSSYREVDRFSRLYWLWADNMRDWEYQRGHMPVYGEYPVWMPDGRILYQATKPPRGLTIMNSDTYNPVLILADDNAKALTLSPDGQSIAFMSPREGKWDIYRVQVDGSGLLRLTDSPANDGLPAWSPDGRSIAFVSDSGGQWRLWIMNANGSNPSVLTNLPGPVDGRVEFEPDYLNHGWLEEQLSWSR